jgi:hypothetical protein
MLLTVIVSRQQTETASRAFPVYTIYAKLTFQQCISYIFLVGASAGTLTTLTFLYVLARFPSFLLHVRSEGADPHVVVRLTTFYQLNVSLCLHPLSKPSSATCINSVSGLYFVSFYATPCSPRSRWTQCPLPSCGRSVCVPSIDHSMCIQICHEWLLASL